MAPALEARRRLPRIVPAIPHRLARPLPAARPITPEESNKGTVVQPEIQPEHEPQAVVVQQPEEEGALETPLTPDSRASVADKSETDAAVLASSPARSQHDSHEQTRELQGLRPFDIAPPTLGVAKLTPCCADASPHPPSIREPVANDLSSELVVPAELPPPFYSSDKPDVQTPPAETGRMSHRHQLSAGALEFRSANESPALPATPRDMELDLSGQQQPLPRPPPGFAPPLATPYFTGHSHHVSDAGPPWLHPPYPLVPPDPTYETGGGYQSSSTPIGPTTSQSSYNGHFSGPTTSHSQSPSKSNLGKTRLGSDHAEEKHGHPYQNGTAPLAERLEGSPFELAAYLSTQFGNPEFADFILQIRSPESILVSVPVHGIVVVRSPMIAEAIRRCPAPVHRSRDVRRLVDIHALDPFVTRESLEEAVKVLYGAPLLSPQTFLYRLGPYLYESDQAPSSSDAQRRMQQALSYVAAARSLHMPGMQASGVEIVRLLLRWDTIDQALHYGLQASITSRPRIEGPETEDPFTTALLNYAIDFMAYTFPVDFKLYTIAPELQDAPRLPTVIETRTPAHNPRLSKIRFGDAPPEDDLQPSHATMVLSTVLLSLPLPLIERMLNHRAMANQIGWTGVVKLMRDVINERENRRQKARRGQLRSAHHGAIPSSLLNNMYMEEHMEPSPLYPSGYRLTTKLLPGDA